MKALQLVVSKGEYPHHRGLQIVDDMALQKLSKSINFFRPVNIHVGHHIGNGGIKLPARVAGKVKRLIHINDNLLAEVEYNEVGATLYQGGYRWSATWEMQSLGKGKYRPIRLLELALTRDPNIRDSGSNCEVIREGFILCKEGKEEQK